MERFVLRDIPFRVDLLTLLNMLHLDATGDDAESVRCMATEAESVARPKALIQVGYVDEQGDNHVIVNGQRLASRVLRVNLGDAQRVFAYVATAGTELEAWADEHDDLLERYWADGIMLQAVRVAASQVADFLQERFRPGRLARMNPGSLASFSAPLRWGEELQ